MRKMIVGFIIGGIVNLLLAWGIYELWGSGPFLFALYTLFAAPIILAFKDRLLGWLMFFVYDRERFADVFLKWLVDNDMPNPGEYCHFELDPDDYLSGITGDESARPTHRIKAANMIGELEGSKLMAPFHVMRVRIALKRALQRYSRRFPGESWRGPSLA